MKIAIVGAGAIGGFFAARLASGGCEVSMLARGAALEAIRTHGIRLESEGRSYAGRVRASDSAAELGPHDVVIPCVKAPALPAVAQQIAPLIGPATTIVPALNGVPWWFFLGGSGPLAGLRLAAVDPDGAIERALPFAQVLGCVVYPACTGLAPGHVKHSAGNRIVFGEPAGGPSERANAVAALFTRSGLAGEVTADIRKEVWAKLLGNACFNPVSLITGSSTDRLIDDAPLHALFVRMMGEAIALGKALGIDVGIDPVARIALTRKLGNVKTSMLQDAEAGRVVEIGGILGTVVEAARAAGVPVPLLDAVHALARMHAEVAGLLPAAA